MILVEQSVNVALTVANRAYFMEKGEVRFEGPATELLNRPDLLRSVFLRAAPPAERCATASGEHAGQRPQHPRRQGRAGRPPVLEVREVTRRFGACGLDGVSFDVRPGEILGFIGPNGAGKTTLFDVISGYTAADLDDPAARRRGARRPPRRPDVRPPGGAWAVRSRTAGCSWGSPSTRPSPSPSSSTSRCATRSRHAAPAVRGRFGGEGPRPSRRADRAAGAGRLSRQVRARAVDWHAAGRRPRACAGAGPTCCCWTSCPAASPSGRPKAGAHAAAGP